MVRWPVHNGVPGIHQGENDIMKAHNKPRLRYFESSPAQQHIAEHDRYIYALDEPAHRMNVIGIGTIGHEHIRVAELLGRVRVAGVYDSAALSIDSTLDQLAPERRAGIRRFDTLEAACMDPDADALMICTPNHTHFDVLRVAIQSGKPIFLEKPMATTLEHAAAIVKMARDYPAFIQIGLQYRYKAPYLEARHEALSRASLGDIRMLAMSEYRPPFLDKVGQWNKFNRCSGGTLVEKCCHYFDLLNLFAGTRPQRVFASAGQAQNFVDFEYDGQPSDIDDHAFAIVDYGSGVRASFALSMFAPQFHEELIVTGSDGRLIATERFDFYRDRVAESTVRIERGETGATRDIRLSYPDSIETSGHHGSTFFEHQAFADQLDGRPADCASVEEGFWSIVVAAAAQFSAASGAAVDVAEMLDEHGLGEFAGELQ